MKCKNIFIALFIISMLCGISAAEEIVVDNTTVNTDMFTEENNDVLFESNVDAQLFDVEQSASNDSVTITLAANAPEDHEQVIGLDVSNVEGFSGTVCIDHYTDTGVLDYSTTYSPEIVDGVAYIPVEFSTVIITPIYSIVRNGDFELGSSGITPPQNWTGGFTGLVVDNTSKSGNRCYQISGGTAIGGLISQSTTLTPGYYTVGAWIKSSGVVAGGGLLNIDLNEGTPSVDTGGAKCSVNTPDWTWIEARQYVGSTNFAVRVFVDSSPAASEKWWIDGVVVAADQSYTATETNDATHVYQNFTFTPATINNTAQMITSFVDYNLSEYTVTGCNVKIDGNTVTSSYDPSYRHIFFDMGGLSASAHTVNVTLTCNPLAPVASFTYTRDGNTYHFTDTSSRSPTSWYWDFGDNNTSTAQNPTHTYATSGSYPVTLIATNAGGASTEGTNNVNYMTQAPNNYSHYIDVLFQPNMTGWDMAENMGTFYNDFLPLEIFWLIVLLMPLLTMWNRQNSVILVCIIYLMAGGLLASKTPVMFGEMGLWMLVLGLAGIMYQMFMRE